MNNEFRKSLEALMNDYFDDKELIKRLLNDENFAFFKKFNSEILEAVADYTAPMRDSTHLILSMLNFHHFPSFTDEAIEEIIKKCNEILEQRLGQRKLIDAIRKSDRCSGEHIDITTEEEKKLGITGFITTGSDTIIDNKTGLPQGLDHVHFRMGS